MSVYVSSVCFLKVCGCRLNCTEYGNVVGEEEYVRNYTKENYGCSLLNNY